VSDTYKTFRAQVKWCRRVPDNKQPSCGIGVQFTGKSPLSSGTNSANAMCPCDYCEERFPIQWIHRTETGLQLCPDCLDHLETMPRSLEEAIERFLLGNVV
jgi:hypothetical protein